MDDRLLRAIDLADPRQLTDGLLIVGGQLLV
jgi:hypothetical protein